MKRHNQGVPPPRYGEYTTGENLTRMMDTDQDEDITLPQQRRQQLQRPPQIVLSSTTVGGTSMLRRTLITEGAYGREDEDMLQEEGEEEEEDAQSIPDSREAEVEHRIKVNDEEIDNLEKTLQQSIAKISLKLDKLHKQNEILRQERDVMIQQSRILEDYVQPGGGGDIEETTQQRLNYRELSEIRRGANFHNYLPTPQVRNEYRQPIASGVKQPVSKPENEKRKYQPTDRMKRCKSEQAEGNKPHLEDYPNKRADFVPPRYEYKSPEQSANPIEQLAATLANLLNNQNAQTERFVARQGDSSKLPSFTGDPLDWPIFQHHYEQSTRDCKFTPAQNMSRLEKCLKGEARKTVQALMIIPTNSDVIMRRLEERYGRPEYIIQSLVDIAKKTPTPKENRLSSILDYSNAISNLVTTVETLNVTEHLFNPHLMKELIDKLPDTLKLQWGQHAKDLENVNLVDLSDWMSDVARAASMVSTPTFTKFQPGGRNRGGTENVNAIGEDISSSDGTRCSACNTEGHQIQKCPVFEKKPNDARWDIVRRKRLCFKCLKYGHTAPKCRSSASCGIGGCNRRHHKLLHYVDSSAGRNKMSPETPPVFEKEECHSNVNISTQSVLLRVLPVKLYGPDGWMVINALLDEASTVTMLSEAVADKLKLRGPLVPLQMRWTNGDIQTDDTSRRVTLKISAVPDGKQYKMDRVRTVKKLLLPVQQINKDDLTHLWPHLDQMDWVESLDEPPQMLIGQYHAHLHVARDVIEAGDKAPMLTNTKLGWVIHGPVAADIGTEKREKASYCLCVVDDDHIHSLVKESFQLESVGITSIAKLRSKEDDAAEELFLKITKRHGNRWTTGLLWRDPGVTLPESRQVAEIRLNSLWKKFKRDHDLELKYKEKLQHYIDRGYLRKVLEDKLAVKTGKEWYHPHFAATHPQKPGKIRIVFDARRLNEYLLTGPDILNSLPGTLVKFRQKEVAFIGDITEMFHQIEIQESDWPAQRILWKWDENAEVEVFELVVLMFGSSCSPFCANSVRNMNAKEFENEFPEAAFVIIHKHYMDDYPDSVDNVEEACRLITQVANIHQRGGFKIGKWISNKTELLRKLNVVPVEKMKSMLTRPDEQIERVLGLHWDPANDMFTFVVNTERAGRKIVTGERLPTKREILRLVMLIFDPMGYIAHYIIKAKILLQQLWRIKIGWDEELPWAMHSKWNNWVKQLPSIADVKIARWYSVKKNRNKLTPSNQTEKEYSLHIFSDASECAYCAVVYLRIEDFETGDVDVSLVMAKTRVCPLKPVSIPRLELQAALIGCRLGSFLKQQLEIKIENIQHWTDSRVVELWIKSEAKRFNQFVANRVGEIQELSNASQWRWVPTQENVADDGTRDGKCDLSNKSRWFRGPEFLKLSPDQWPINKEKYTSQDELEVKTNSVLSCVEIPSIPIPDVRRFSSFIRCVRATAAVLKFVYILKKIEFDELPINKAENLLYQRAQWEGYPSEMCALTNKISIQTNSKILQLSPALNKHGVMIMDSRIGLKDSPDLSQPVLLPPENYLTRLIIEMYHRLAHHHNIEQVINEVRQRYWIPKLRTTVKKIVRDCKMCKLKKKKTETPLMGKLPDFRVTPQRRAFIHVGMDYFGPIEVTVGRKREKRYGVLFTCLNTRAVHLEVAHNLTTDGCIMALRRMMSRRGQPDTIHSDNGTNLKGAEKELRLALQEIDEPRIHLMMTVRGISWRFIPPATPHMGGVYERLVKSVKTALYTILKCRAPSDEMLLTVMTEAEATVNSRPLTEVPVDPESPEALTPMHFLIGTSSMLLPPGSFGDEDLCLTRRWRYTQRLADLFWHRWVREFLPGLRQRKKWHRYIPNLEKGDIIILIDESLKRNTWPLGIVTDVFPGKDGIVRVVEIRTASGVYKRPAVKIVKLDIRANQDP